MSVSQLFTPVEVATETGSVTMHVSIVSVEFRKETGIRGPVAGLAAHIRLTSAPAGKPAAMFLSRLVGETRWTADAHFGSDGFPFFSHGFGARYTIPRVLGREIAALIDATAVSSELVPALDQQSPLTLPGQQD